MHQRQRTAAVRNARNAPAMHLRSVAEPAGVNALQLTSALRRLPGRGRCAELARHAASNADGRVAAAAVASRRCPPPAARAAPSFGSNILDREGHGTPGWAGKRLPRRYLIARAANGSVQARWEAAIDARCWPALAVAMSDDPDPNVSGAAMANPCINPLRFALSADWNQRCAAALNPACTPEMMERLLGDAIPHVSHQAANRDNAGMVMVDALRGCRCRRRS